MKSIRKLFLSCFRTCCKEESRSQLDSGDSEDLHVSFIEATPECPRGDHARLEDHEVGLDLEHTGAQLYNTPSECSIFSREDYPRTPATEHPGEDLHLSLPSSLESESDSGQPESVHDGCVGASTYRVTWTPVFAVSYGLYGQCLVNRPFQRARSGDLEDQSWSSSSEECLPALTPQPPQLGRSCMEEAGERDLLEVVSLSSAD